MVLGGAALAQVFHTGGRRRSKAMWLATWVHVPEGPSLSLPPPEAQPGLPGPESMPKATGTFQLVPNVLCY